MGVADFDGDSNPDFALFNPTTLATKCLVLSGKSLQRLRTKNFSAWPPEAGREKAARFQLAGESGSYGATSEYPAGSVGPVAVPIFVVSDISQKTVPLVAVFTRMKSGRPSPLISPTPPSV